MEVNPWRVILEDQYFLKCSITVTYKHNKVWHHVMFNKPSSQSISQYISTKVFKFLTTTFHIVLDGYSTWKIKNWFEDHVKKKITKVKISPTEDSSSLFLTIIHHTHLPSPSCILRFPHIHYCWFNDMHTYTTILKETCVEMILANLQSMYSFKICNQCYQTIPSPTSFLHRKSHYISSVSTHYITFKNIQVKKLTQT
jgi:hypothetical protein